MNAYYNLLASKGITNINELLQISSKKVIVFLLVILNFLAIFNYFFNKSLNSLKISQADTNKLWNEIQLLKSKLENHTEHIFETSNKRQKLNGEVNSFGENSKNNIQNDPTNNDQNTGMVKISKFQIKYSFEMRK